MLGDAGGEHESAQPAEHGRVGASAGMGVAGLKRLRAATMGGG
jgi:hypothetical protein